MQETSDSISNINTLDNPRAKNQAEIDAYHLTIHNDTQEMVHSINSKLEQAQSSLHNEILHSKQLKIENGELEDEIENLKIKIEFLEKEGAIKQEDLINTKKIL